MNSIHLFLVIFLQFVSYSNGASIMFFMGLSSYSHRISIWPLAEALAEKGHSVTFVSPFKAKVPNPKITDMVPKKLFEWVETWNETDGFFKQRIDGTLEYEWYKLTEYSIGACEHLMTDADFIKHIKDIKIDLMIIDALGNECGYGMAYFHKAITIIYDTANPFPWYTDIFGFPDESSWVPDMIFHYPVGDLNIFQRAMALFNPIYVNYLRHYKAFPVMEQMIRNNLIADLPSLIELERNTSLLFTNHHFSEDFPRAFPPNVITLGGLHCDEKPTKVSKEIEDFLNTGNPNDGFIYMSFGTYAEISNFPNATRDVFVNTLKKLKNIKIIWKINVERPSDLPDNVYTSKWMPQQAILAQPKIRAFITHGGLLGIHEAICNPVPMIVFPIFAEQDYNAEKIQWRKIGIKLEITTVTENSLFDAIEKVTNDQMYINSMKDLSKRFKDRPSKPLDDGVWWTEYVLRHDDTSALRPLSVYQSWWKKRQLDIWFSVFSITLGMLYFITKILKWLVKSLVNDNMQLKPQKAKLS